MFFNVDDLREIINEMEIDGEKQDNNDDVTDYTSEPQDDETPDTTDDSNNSDTENDSNTEPDDNDTEPEDYTQMNDSDDEDQDGDNKEESDKDSTDGESSDDTTDYTQMSDEDNNEDDSSSDSEGGEDNNTSSDDTSSEDSEDTDSDNTEEESSDNDEDNSFENLKKIEAELFSNLTDEQIAIKNTELKNQYIDLYTTIGRTLVRINDVAKTDDNIEILKFVTDKLLELRDMIDFNITTAFNTRTYIENNIIYQQCLSTLNAISDILSNTPSPEKQNIENDEYENSIEDRENTSEMENEKQLNVSDTSKMEESAFYFNDYL